MSLKDQVILITGAGGGLGGTAAVALARQGAHIVLLDNKIPKIEAVYDRIKTAGGAEPALYPFDLAGANESEFQELAVKIENRYGALQGLLHSAVEFPGFTPVAVHNTKDWGHTLNVNLNGPFMLTRVLLPVMQKSEAASIVFTSDSSVRSGTAFSGAYGVSKIAVEGFARILAEELQGFKKIRVNILVPGPVASPLRNRAYPAEDKSKLPEISSLESVYTFLFGSQSLGITGQTIDARTFHL